MHMKDKFRDDLNREIVNYSSDSIEDFEMSRRYLKRSLFIFMSFTGKTRVNFLL